MKEVSPGTALYYCPCPRSTVQGSLFGLIEILEEEENS